MWSPVEARGGGGGPCARGKHSATLLGAHVYVLGGRGAGGNLPLRDFWRYTIATGEWEKLSGRGSPPPSLQEHTATAHGARLYVFGGEATALSAETPLWIYDTETEFWRKLPGQASCSGTVRRRAPGRGARGAGAAGGPSGRRGHSAHALKDCLLIYGGYKDLRGSSNELWAFHYESESWQSVTTRGAGGPARHRHAAALLGARLYVHAGQSDLRLCSDLWSYDTISRVWSQVRTPAKLSPGARSGHAAVRAGGHLYIFGGDCGGQPDNDMWRFQFATETWDRIVPSVRWPGARVDACALLVAGGAGAARARAPPPAAPPPRPAPTLLSRLSSLHVRRAPRAGAAYSVLAASERDSSESLARDSPALRSSRSAHLLARPRLPREPISVPDFADMVLPTPVLSPAQAAKLVYLDSDEEEELRREPALPASTSVRFTGDAAPATATDSEEGEFSTSDYASAERVNRLSGFSNPHYLGPDVRALGAALTPDSGVAPGDIELQELGPRAARARERDDALLLLLVGGREPPHVARLQGPLSMWTYRLL